MSAAGARPPAHPTPREAFELARAHADLLRALFNHPAFVYMSPPTPQRYPVDAARTPAALLLVSEFVQTTFVEHVLPFLPTGATRRCRTLANPWAYADPDYKWDWVWDDAAGELCAEADGAVQLFPDLGARAGARARSDIWTRGFLASKAICDNATDPKARMICGGQEFDFGEDARRLIGEVLNK
jgi:hypothetical protein